MMTILAALAQKRAGKIPCFTLPGGAQLPLGVYVEAWKRVKKGDPQRVIRGFAMFDYTAEEVLQTLSAGVQDRINLRGGIRTDWPETRQERLYRRLSKTVVCECRNCSNILPSYEPRVTRFCSDQCRADFWR